MKKSFLHRLGAFVLALCMTLSLLPAFSGEAEAAYSDSAMDDLLNWGVINGYPDGGLYPENTLSRAEFVAMTNRAYGYKQVGPIPFTDVPEDSWFHDDIAIAYNANYFTGVDATTADPRGTLTREQALVLLARNMRLDPIPGEVTEFSDGHDFGKWSRGYVRAAAQAGVVNGYPDGSCNPKGEITRGEMAVMLRRALGMLVNQPGTHTLSDTYGNVTISSPGTTLKDTTIAGDLYITGGLDLGDITLENVRVLGDIIVAGGGESESGESIILRNVEADSLKVDSIADQYVSLAAEGNTVIENVSLRSDSYVQDRTRPGEGLMNINLEAVEPGAQFTLSGNLETVVNKSPSSLLKIAMGTVDDLKIDEKATGSTLNLDINSTAMRLNLDTGVSVVGVGDISKLYVNAPGSDVEMLPDTITIRPGLTADVAGETMDAKQAQESSSDPRLLAGYPKVKNIAPTSATSVYAANKGGTVYWAISTTTDGSIGEEELVEPTEDNARIYLNGTTPVEAADTEYTAALDQLAADSNYYLSTVMVDARGRHSPVKVASFTTPDNTVPAFTAGYPAVLRNYCESVTFENPNETDDPNERYIVDRDSEQFPRRNYRVQIAAMPNKTCQLYYAVYEKGSTAPTAQQFRTGALGKPVRSGVDDAVKNRISYIELTNLDELTDYDIYLCLIDADGSRSSAVQKLTFKTVDGKPPRFQYDSPIVTQEQLTALRLNINVNEDATVYWVVSKSENYIKDNRVRDAEGKLIRSDSDWSETEWWERACRQIESGTNSVRNGNVRVRGNVDTVLNITGLEPATKYYVYFVAKDSAGNYSEFFRENHTYNVKTNTTPPKDRIELDVTHNEQPYKYYISANTLDNVPPEVKQEFTHYDAADHTRPYADTDIKLIFTEEVMQYSTNRQLEVLNTFKSLYLAMKAAEANHLADPGDADKTTLWQLAQEAYVGALSNTVKLYNASATGNESVEERTAANENTPNLKWIIDYRYVEVDVDDDTGALTLTFPGEYSTKDPSKRAVNLSSGSTYYFVFDDIADISTSRNRMPRTQLDNFTTVSAQVQLRTINVTSITDMDDSSKRVDIDMAFSMTPVSTNVESDIDWDIVFWSDTSVNFEIYELTAGTNNTTGRPVRRVVNGEYNPADAPSDVQIVNNNTTINEDVKLDDYEGYVGRTLFRDFYKLNFNPSVTGEGNVISDKDSDMGKYLRERGTMVKDTDKYYGIHFTKIGSVDEDAGRGKIWDATINFRLSVLTGASPSFTSLVGKEINKENMAKSEEELGLAQIHSPRPFFMRAQFSNNDAPNFANAWPQFETTDTTMKLNVMLDRPGTLYWVIAPASTRVRQNDNTIKINYTPTIDTNAYDGSSNGVPIKLDDTITDKNSTLYQRYYMPVSGEGAKQKLLPLNGSDALAAATPPAEIVRPFELSAPSNDQIYSPNFGSERIKSGRKVLGRGMESIEVDGLEPDTIYLVYFVMQGTGQVYSPRAQVFQTRTAEITRPYLILTNNTDSATITSTNMDARADCGLFLLDRLNDMALFTTPLKQVLDSERVADFESRYWVTVDSSNTITDGRKDENSRYYHEYTVLEAMRQRDLDGRGGSLFDIYAAEDYKNQIAQMIRAEGSSDRIDGKRDLFIPVGATKGEEFKSDKMSQDAVYALLVVARADAGEDNASGHSLGFAAAYDLYVRDDATPKLTAVSGSMKVNYQATGAPAGGFLMGGEVTLTFDRPLYLYDEATKNRRALTSAKINDKTGEGLIAAGYNSNVTVAAVTGAGSTTVQTVKLTLPEDTFTDDTIIYINPQLAGQYSPALEKHSLKITLHYDPSLRKVVANVSDADLWLTEGTSTVLDTTVIAPKPTGLSLDSSLTLQSGESATLTANILPAGADGTITWTVGNGSVASVSPNTGNTVTVKGGVVTSGAPQTNITATLRDVSGTVVAEVKCLVTVTPIKVTSITLDQNSVTFHSGLQLVQVTVSPTDAAQKDITFTVTRGSDLISVTKQVSGNANSGVYILEISRGSNTTGTGPATIVISATDGSGVTAVCYVTVE